jgi:hypothetical protein
MEGQVPIFISPRIRWPSYVARHWIPFSSPPTTQGYSKSIQTCLHPGPFFSEVEVEVNLRRTVSRPVCIGVRHPSGTCGQFFFLLEISFRQLCVCYFVAPSLTRGRVCNLLYNCFWALTEQSLLGRSPAELTTIFYCLVWDSPNLEGQVPLFISPRNRVAQLYPRALGSFSEVIPFLLVPSWHGPDRKHRSPLLRPVDHAENTVPLLHNTYQQPLFTESLLTFAYLVVVA